MGAPRKSKAPLLTSSAQNRASGRSGGVCADVAPCGGGGGGGGGGGLRHTAPRPYVHQTSIQGSEPHMAPQFSPVQPFGSPGFQLE